MRNVTRSSTPKRNETRETVQFSIPFLLPFLVPYFTADGTRRVKGRIGGGSSAVRTFEFRFAKAFLPLIRRKEGVEKLKTVSVISE